MGQMLPCLSCGSCWPETKVEGNSDVEVNKLERKIKALSEVGTSANQSPLIETGRKSVEFPEEMCDFLRFFQAAELAATLPVSSELMTVRNYKYANGGVYTGQTVAGRRHGQGEMKWSPEDWYSGHWSEGLPTEIGKMRLSSGKEYEGEWLKPTFIGAALLIEADPEYLESWLAALNDGYGDLYIVWLWYSVRRLQVSPSLSQPSGPDQQLSHLELNISAIKHALSIAEQCYLRNPDTCKFFKSEQYFGLSEQRKMHGIGRYTYNADCLYEGEWKQGRRDGFGAFFWPQKNYQGRWKAGHMDGFGVMREGEVTKCGIWIEGALSLSLYPKQLFPDHSLV